MLGQRIPTRSAIVRWFSCDIARAVSRAWPFLLGQTLPPGGPNAVEQFAGHGLNLLALLKPEVEHEPVTLEVYTDGS